MAPSMACASHWPFCAERPSQRAAVRGAGAVEIESRQKILRVGIAEIRGRVGEHLARALRVALDFRLRNSLEIIMTERNEGVRDEARLRQVGIVVGVAVRDAAEIFESLEIVLRNAVAFGIHAAEFPLRERVTFL